MQDAGSEAGARPRPAHRRSRREAGHVNGARVVVRASLFLLVALYAAWFGILEQWIALAVFALPALALALWLPRAIGW